jgi:hypothetical protein
MPFHWEIFIGKSSWGNLHGEIYTGADSYPIGADIHKNSFITPNLDRRYYDVMML